MRLPLPRAMLLPLLPAILAIGCATYDPVAARREQTDAFTNALARAEVEWLSHPLSLDDCVRIAMTNNYAVRKADLDRELSRIGRNVAFTAFLPNVAAAGGYSAYAKQPNIMTERRFGSGNLDIGMPLFLPSSWFLYAAARQGHAAAGIVSHYVRQGIVLQTTLDYYDVLVRRETVAALETQVRAARENASRVEGLAREGFFQAWEADQARLQVESREVELHRETRQFEVSKGRLLAGMGLSPTAKVTLAGDGGAPGPSTNGVETLVLQALAVHPTLALADRQVVIREHEVRQAFCDFLPKLSLFSTSTWTANDLEDHSANWLLGLRGTWTLFDGLANVARYRAAKVERRRGELDREAAFLNVMIQVIAAHTAVRDAAENAGLLHRAYDVAVAKSAQYDARSHEGLIPLGDALDARAAMDLAQVDLVRARYAERIAVANLELAVGTTLVPTPLPKAEQP